MIRRLVVHIDSLRLDGFERAASAAVALALQRELTEALTNPTVAGAFASAGSAARMQLNPVRAPADATPECIGSMVARAVAGGGRP